MLLPESRKLSILRPPLSQSNKKIRISKWSMGTGQKSMAIHRQTIAKEQVDSQDPIRRNDEDVPHHRVAAIVAIELKHLNGVAVQMVLGLFAMLVDCVSLTC